MNLPFKFGKNNQKTAVFYLALLLTSEKTTAIILEEISGKLKILSRESQYFDGKIEDIPVDDLIEYVDKSMSKAVEVMPADAEVRNTVFGVKENWVESESKKIKKDYLHKLKKVCDALELTPIGFMVVSEAIANLLQKEEGVPVSAILVEHGRKKLTATLIRGGKNLQTVEGVIDGNEAQTVDRLLKHFTIEVLPARIILYNDGHEDDLVQQFVSHQWSKSLPFLHLPQISVLHAGFDGHAVAYGAAAQMGFEVLEEAGSSVENYKQGEHEAVKHKSVEEEKVGAVESKSEVENFGFVTGQDVALMVSSNHGVERPGHEKKVDHIDVEEDDEDDEVAVDKRVEDVGIVDEEEEDGAERKQRGIKMPGFKMPEIRFNGILIIFLVILLLAGAVGGGVYYFYTYKVKASVVVDLTAKNGEQESDVVFGKGEDNDFSNNVLAAEEVSDSLSGDMTVGTTGKKDVGEKAKGEVTIYNNSVDSDTTLSSGTTIKSENGLSFVLDKDVNVASATGDVFSGTKPGTASVDVTAGDIGSNYNLPSGTKFSVGGNGSLAGKNDSAFSGGSKSSVKIVSNDDLVQLKTNLVKSLEDKALGELLKKGTSDSIVLPVILSNNVSKSKYDNTVGAEAKTIKLTATIDFSGLAYRESDVKSFAKTVLAEDYGQDKTISDDSIDVGVASPKKKSDEEVSAKLRIQASILPKIDAAKVSKQISGASKTEADKILSRLPQAEGNHVSYSPNIYFLEKLFPNLPKNVTVTLSSN